MKMPLILCFDLMEIRYESYPCLLRGWVLLWVLFDPMKIDSSGHLSGSVIHFIKNFDIVGLSL